MSTTTALEQYLLSLAYQCPTDIPYSKQEREDIETQLAKIPLALRIQPHMWTLRVSTKIWQLLRGSTYTEFPLYSVEYWAALRNEYMAMSSAEQMITRAQMRAAHDVSESIDLHLFLSGYEPPVPGELREIIEPAQYQKGVARKKCSKCNLAAVAGHDLCASHYADITEDTTAILREQIKRARVGLGMLLDDAVEALGDNVRNAERDADRTAAAAQILDRAGVTKATAADIFGVEEDDSSADAELEQLLGRVSAAALERARAELAAAQETLALPQASVEDISVALQEEKEAHNE